MSNEVIKVPTIGELFIDNIADAFKTEQLNCLLNHEPKKEWVKVHPFIKGYNYIPIDKVEFLLRKIFKRYRIEITGQGTSFNGVYVTVRVHYWNPVFNDWDFHDGIGAVQLQTAKGTSPADLNNINNGALSMAYPIAKTIAIKDACDHFGKLFGCDLNRKDTLSFSIDSSLQPVDYDILKALYDDLETDLLITPEIEIVALEILKTKDESRYKKFYNSLLKLKK